MRPLGNRLDRCIAVALAAIGLACEDEPVTPRRYIPLVQPLTLSFQGATIAVSAAAELRVDWTVRIESVPGDSTATPARHRRTFDDQTLIAFAWDRSHNVGVVAFAPGDSCVASVSYPQLDPAAPGARVGFRLP